MLRKWVTLGLGFALPANPIGAVRFSQKFLWFRRFPPCARTGTAAAPVDWLSRLCIQMHKQHLGIGILGIQRRRPERSPLLLAVCLRFWLPVFPASYIRTWTEDQSCLWTLLSMNLFEHFLHLPMWSFSRLLWELLPAVWGSTFFYLF